MQATLFSGADAPDQAGPPGPLPQPEASLEASLENTTARMLLLAPSPAVMAPAPAADKVRRLVGTPFQAPRNETATAASALPAAARSGGYPSNAQNVASALAADKG